MSKGYCGRMQIADQDDHYLLYTYGCCNINLPNYKDFYLKNEDGEIWISKDALIEPEIHTKVKKWPSGRKETIVKRVPRDVHVNELITTEKIRVKNASGTWHTFPDGMDEIAFYLLYKFFDEYQKTGSIPESIIWFV